MAIADRDHECIHVGGGGVVRHNSGEAVQPSALTSAAVPIAEQQRVLLGVAGQTIAAPLPEEPNHGGGAPGRLVGGPQPRRADGLLPGALGFPTEPSPPCILFPPFHSSSFTAL